MIDHAVLHPTQTGADVRAACELCDRLGVASICVKPSYVALAAELLADSPVRVSTVIGFPHGGTGAQAKAAETAGACEAGAVEVDMVINLGKAIEEDWDYIAADIAAVVDTAKTFDAITKVILETGLLPGDAIKRKLCEIAEQAGAAFVKTSTGFGFVKGDAGSLTATGATEHDLRLMRSACSNAVEVKASGGIRSYEDAARFVELGATRLGTSATEAIANGELSKTDY